jgi:hypothetical protein
MIRLKNGTGQISKVGYLVKIMPDKQGYFDIAGVGDPVCGVISQSVSPNQPCDIITNGEALIYLHKKILPGKLIRQQIKTDGAVKGTCMPTINELGANIVARSIDGGKGLIRATVELSGGLNKCFGSMYNFDTPTAVSILATNTFYQVPSGFSKGEVNNSLFENSREIIVGTVGYYHVTWSIAFTAATGNQEIEGTIMVNGTENTNFASHRKIGTGTDTGSMGGNGIVRLDAGDIVSLCVNNETSTSNVTVEHANMSVIQVG